MQTRGVLSIGAAAGCLGVRPWQIRRAIARGLLPEPPRFGPHRMFAEADLPKIRRALAAAGYLAAAAKGERGAK